MEKVKILKEKCKGCGLCVSVCPKKILKISTEKLNTKGYYPSTCIDQDACIACAMCATICPDCVISIEK